MSPARCEKNTRRRVFFTQANTRRREHTYPDVQTAGEMISAFPFDGQYECDCLCTFANVFW